MQADYETLRARHLAEAMALVPEHLERIMWPAERLQAERQLRLSALLRVALKRSRWHRERLGDLDPDRLTEEDLPRLPVMTKDDVMANFDSIVTDRRLSLDLVESHLATLTKDAYLLDHYHAVASGGSSGRRGIFVYDWNAWTLCYLSLRRHGLRFMAGQVGATTAPVTMAKVGAARALHVSSAIAQTFSNPALVIHRFPMSLPTDRIVAGLNSLQPDVLEGYSSALYQLAKQAQMGTLKIAPRLISAISEPLLPEIRTALEEMWSVPVLNVWGTSEGGGCAASCGQAPGMHLSDDLLIIEPVDATGRPAPAGCRSAKIYLTNLYNLALPLIRYEITDEVTLLDEACACGSPHRKIEDIQGRLDDSFLYQGECTVHPHVFRSALAGERNIVEYQVRQTSRGAAVMIVCQGEVDGERLKTKIVDGLIEVGIDGPEILITRVERLERLPTGKLKRFIPLPLT